jgi:hypothetical protein
VLLASKSLLIVLLTCGRKLPFGISGQINFLKADNWHVVDDLKRPTSAFDVRKNRAEALVPPDDVFQRILQDRGIQWAVEVDRALGLEFAPRIAQRPQQSLLGR